MKGIYKITSPSGKIYIGQSKDINKRFKAYYRKLGKSQPRLYNSFKKYGIENHIFEVIEECLFEELNNRERYWQEYYEVVEKGLNCIYVNDDEKKLEFSEESKVKISETLKKNYKNGYISPTLGIKRSETSIKNMSNSQIISWDNYEKRKKQSETIKNLYNNGYIHPNLGKKASCELKKKLSESQLKLIASGHIPNNSKMVINLDTGIFYDSAKKAFESQEQIKCVIDFRKKLRENKIPFQYL